MEWHDRNKNGNLAAAVLLLPWRESLIKKSVADKARTDNDTGVTNTPCATD